METAAGQWAAQARYDLDTARAMLLADRYLYVLFCCQQAVEKALKAVIVQKTGELPPRLHNLPKLAEIAGVQFSSERALLTGDLSGYYIKTRYPGTLDRQVPGTTVESSETALCQTEELVEWLLSMLEC